ncbi:MAG: farnesyl diphosphate synthase [Pseudomonadota bacterium]|nr:geranyl transferase [Gammaproteobacteria bacterium]MEE2683609.1 farnesyl diphosphate synthase [Pseudomonadota bacterium]|tara:strand:- start:3817 stop:4725 length:909 start_codon:yes stop_codon:yes gene_type:complete
MVAYKQKHGSEEKLSFYKKHINNKIESFLEKYPNRPTRLLEAIKYSALLGGKRIRALLVYGSGEMLSVDREILDPIAVSIELIHSFSLIHDDLPSMDNDDLRRGRPTLHRAFDEGTAILTGDILQTIAFDIVINIEQSLYSPLEKLKLLEELAFSIGLEGMTGGQYLDLNVENAIVDEDYLKDVYTKKTGSLIKAAIMMPSYLTNIEKSTIKKLEIFSSYIGLAYQIKDDLLEIEQTTEIIGKNSNSDNINHKITFPSLIGVAESKRRLIEYSEIAIDAISEFGNNGLFLKYLGEIMTKRER